MYVILVVLLVILLLGGVGVAPAWPHSSGWGWGPAGGILGLILVVLLILFLLGRV